MAACEMTWLNSAEHVRFNPAWPVSKWKNTAGTDNGWLAIWAMEDHKASQFRLRSVN